MILLLLALLACGSEVEPSCAVSPGLGVGAGLVDLGTLGPAEEATATLEVHNPGSAPAEVSFQLWFGSTGESAYGPTGYVLSDPGPLVLEPGEHRALELGLRPAWEGPLWDALVVQASDTLTWELAGSATVLLRGHAEGTGLVQAPAPAWLGSPHATPDRLLPGERTTVRSCWYDPEAQVAPPDLRLAGELLHEPESTWLSGGVRCWSWAWTPSSPGEYAGVLEARWAGHQILDFVEISVIEPEC